VIGAPSRASLEKSPKPALPMSCKASRAPTFVRTCSSSGAHRCSHGRTMFRRAVSTDQGGGDCRNPRARGRAAQQALLPRGESLKRLGWPGQQRAGRCHSTPTRWQDTESRAGRAEGSGVLVRSCSRPGRVRLAGVGVSRDISAAPERLQSSRGAHYSHCDRRLALANAIGLPGYLGMESTTMSRQQYPRILPESAAVREAINAAGRLDEVPPSVTNDVSRK